MKNKEEKDNIMEAEKELRFETLQLHGAGTAGSAADAGRFQSVRLRPMFRDCQHAADRFGLADAAIYMERLTVP